ncbi:uncharacterized protein MYCGRDRAFT_90041 [Zymoseptoria tritici IPO323]|uniref:Uncharacterized protein n=1 Tax=Zymoseptoria tritici (strain CBS 115943 / IPO323) TaxID=336722 RepID=F9X0N7_ZYMTI|nr:uncharacterized protein MYCGRDRAFT_90041 [Zymoseptoria tritici IPO323]EGP91980.1 hypothetical protein MYCGRDRAFT_90041 [Zymoseptoria tritici IPO323]
MLSSSFVARRGSSPVKQGAAKGSRIAFADLVLALTNIASTRCKKGTMRDIKTRACACGAPHDQSPGHTCAADTDSCPRETLSGFTAQQTQQLTDAFADAMELAGYVRSPATATKVGQIFEHYFNPVDRKMVDNVYDAILGGDPSHPPGNPLLADITVVPDFTDNRYPNLVCKRGVMAALRYQDTDKPKLFLACERSTVVGHL